MEGNPSKKPIQLDLQLCYSGFNIDELEYIDYTRTIQEENEKAVVPYVKDNKADTGVDFEEERTDGASSECDFEEYVNYSTEEFRSYLCSTPTKGRKHRGSFPHETEISAFNVTETTGTHFASSSNNADSGMHTKSLSKSRHSVASFFGGNCSIPGSIEDYDDLDSIDSACSSPMHDYVRRKIELDEDVCDPYNVDEMELSIEEEITNLSQTTSTSTLGSLRRRLSLKIIRRNISTGLFGSYQQRSSEMQPKLPHPTSSTSKDLVSSGQMPLENKRKPGPQGPLNVFFKKFRNRHFI